MTEPEVDVAKGAASSPGRGPIAKLEVGLLSAIFSPLS